MRIRKLITIFMMTSLLLCLIKIVQLNMSHEAIEKRKTTVLEVIREMHDDDGYTLRSPEDE